MWAFAQCHVEAYQQAKKRPICTGFSALCSPMKGLRAPRNSSIATGFLWMVFPTVVVKCSKQSAAPGDRTESPCFCWTKGTLRRCCAGLENQPEAGAGEEAWVAFEDLVLVLLENLASERTAQLFLVVKGLEPPTGGVWMADPGEISSCEMGLGFWDWDEGCCRGDLWAQGLPANHP